MKTESPVTSQPAPDARGQFQFEGGLFRNAEALANLKEARARLERIVPEQLREQAPAQLEAAAPTTKGTFRNVVLLLNGQHPSQRGAR